jgi:ribose 5-phosphate isomerase B
MKNLITENDILIIYKNGVRVIPLGEDDILTPSAKDKIKELGIAVAKKDVADKIDVIENPTVSPIKTGKIAIGSDHNGFKLKNFISKILIDKGYEIIDSGTYDEVSCDYPDFAFAVASKVKDGKVEFGIIIDATGNPSAITANKLPGIRAANCYNEFIAKSAREHDNANILTLGAKALGEETVKSIIEAWLNITFSGGRDQKRLDKVTSIEKKYLK